VNEGGAHLHIHRIIIESCILNEARVSSYSQAILRHEEILFKGKKLLNKNY